MVVPSHAGQPSHAGPPFPPLPEDNIQVVGAFNATIIRPPWLVKYGLLEANERVDIILPEYGPVAYRTRDVGWQVIGGRLAVQGAVGRTMPMVKMVMSILVHTPVIAAGMNFIRRGDDRRPRDLSGSEIGPMDLDKAGQRWGGKIGHVARTLVVARETVQVTATEVWAGDQRTLEVNFQRESRQINELIELVERGLEFEAELDRIVRGNPT